MLEVTNGEKNFSESEGTEVEKNAGHATVARRLPYFFKSGTCQIRGLVPQISYLLKQLIPHIQYLDPNGGFEETHCP